MSEVLWRPDPARARASQLAELGRALAADGTSADDDFRSVHRWSIRAPDAFWARAWEHLGVVGERGDRALEADRRLDEARFFPDATVGYAENLLRAPADDIAILYAREDGLRRSLSFGELRALVSRVAGSLRLAGVEPGDTVAAWLPNIPEAHVLMLATAAVGATFTSCSPDFNPAAVIDRFGQVAPKVLVVVDGYHYGGAVHDRRAHADEIRAALPTATSAVLVRHVGLRGPWPGVEWDVWLAGGSDLEVDQRWPFDQPLSVHYSSGTTGTPKCIVHRAGGLLLKHLVEHRFHFDLRPRERFLWFTTTGWMMWGWLTSALATGATVVAYDGSPAHPSADALWRLVEELRIDILGVSAKLLDSCDRTGVRPGQVADLSSLRMLGSTGSPLAPRTHDYVFRHVHEGMHLASLSGGTDLCGALVGPVPTEPVRRGEIQGPILGMDVQVVDQDGRRLPPGVPGELVCSTPFPSMPVGLWGDDGSRLRATYFDRFPGFWHQADIAEATPDGGVIISGRSDATLNASGVRIGTAELYRCLDPLDEVADAVAVAQPWLGDTRIVLGVVLAGRRRLDDDLRQRIRDAIRAGASPRHVPARIVQVDDVPRTRTGKLAELAVRDVIAGRAVPNLDALANPEALRGFHDHPELAR